VKDLLILVALFLIACLGHELGHVLVAYAAGWRLNAASAHAAGGFGLVFDTRGRPDRIKMVALGGLLASGVLALVALALMPGVFAWVFFVINASIMLVNMIPVGPSDGRRILR